MDDELIDNIRSRLKNQPSAGIFEMASNKLLGSDLKQTLKPGQRLKIARLCFSMYAYETLKDELEAIESLEFLSFGIFALVQRLLSLHQSSGKNNSPSIKAVSRPRDNAVRTPIECATFLSSNQKLILFGRVTK